MDEKQALLEFAKIELEYAKHHESQRERMTSLILIFSGFCIASVGWDKDINASDLWVGVILALIGMFGVIFSLKHYHHFKRRYSRFREYRTEFGKKFQPSQIIKVKKQGDDAHEDEMDRRFVEGLSRCDPRFWLHHFARKIPLHSLWASLPILVMIFGFVIIFITIFGPCFENA